jgi:allophanate hydrolase
MIVSTAPTMPTLAALESEPVKRNSELGYYTNFVNFFDMAALSVPAMRRNYAPWRLACLSGLTGSCAQARE